MYEKKENKWDMLCTPLYKPNRYVLPKRVGFGAVLARNKYFVHFGFKSGMVFEGSSREGITDLFIVLVIPNK